MSVSKNDITGDSIASRASTQQYRDNYDRIFGNKKINNSGVSGVFVSVVDIPSATPEVTKIIKETEIVSDLSQCENITGEDAEAFCQEFIKLPDSRAVMQKWLERGPTTSEMESMPVISPEQDITDAATRYRSMITLEELSSIPAPTFRRKDGSLSYHEEPSDEIPFLTQVGGTVDATEWFKKTITEVTAPPFIPSTPNLVVAAGTITSRPGIVIEVDDDLNFVKANSNEPPIVNRSEPSYCSYVSDRNIPLVYIGPLLDVPIITVENYCKWYSLFAVMPDGKVRKITSDEIYQAEDAGEALFIDHNFHPRLLNKLAKILNGEVCEQSLEMVAGRWVMEHMEDPYGFVDPAKYEMPKADNPDQ